MVSLTFGLWVLSAIWGHGKHHIGHMTAHILTQGSRRSHWNFYQVVSLMLASIVWAEVYTLVARFTDLWTVPCGGYEHAWALCETHGLGRFFLSWLISCGPYMGDIRLIISSVGLQLHIWGIWALHRCEYSHTKLTVLPGLQTPQP